MAFARIGKRSLIWKIKLESSVPSGAPSLTSKKKSLDFSFHCGPSWVPSCTMDGSSEKWGPCPWRHSSRGRWLSARNTIKGFLVLDEKLEWVTGIRGLYLMSDSNKHQSGVKMKWPGLDFRSDSKTCSHFRWALFSKSLWEDFDSKAYKCPLHLPIQMWLKKIIKLGRWMNNVRNHSMWK